MFVSAARAKGLTRESGQVVVHFAILLPVLFGLGAIVLDIGNWYVHKRHLQTQVDAAALAAAPSFSGCFFDPATANLAIASTALSYAGDTARDPSSTNLQIQEPNDVRVTLIEIHEVKEESGFLPLAVPEIDPAFVYAIFVDYAKDGTQTPLKVQPLKKNASYGGVSFPYSAWVTNTDVPPPASNP